MGNVCFFHDNRHSLRTVTTQGFQYVALPLRQKDATASHSPLFVSLRAKANLSNVETAAITLVETDVCIHLTFLYSLVFTAWLATNPKSPRLQMNRPSQRLAENPRFKEWHIILL